MMAGSAKSEVLIVLRPNGINSIDDVSGIRDLNREGVVSRRLSRSITEDFQRNVKGGHRGNSLKVISGEKWSGTLFLKDPFAQRTTGKQLAERHGSGIPPL